MAATLIEVNDPDRAFFHAAGRTVAPSTSRAPGTKDEDAMRETRLPIDASGRLGASVLLLVLALLQACAADDPERRTKEGAGIGAVTGAVIGHQSDSDRGRFVGAAIGAIAGASVGRYQHEQQRELERALARDRQLNRRVEIYIKPVVEGDDERARIAPRRS